MNHFSHNHIYGGEDQRIIGRPFFGGPFGRPFFGGPFGRPFFGPGPFFGGFLGGLTAGALLSPAAYPYPPYPYYPYY
ncbi:hypothetical protein P9D34_11040 [Bacillus swezeyi]|uniref:Uncharacterized protein n=1 Tax=Bacillus swezeyi TaxID=1925020 RepID=A0A1R1RZJ4_9BACI|nr:hypothetical protein [Bacillus swezeyi]KAA6452760.1 hypothetical protein DX927_00645 [Bacillus swezeyi]KAA6476619.1 hypothetical protein DX928_11275 [Bacillus swezeyi]MEC1260983.1 hypothetical protein [Bacillus swezeyi]MED1741932.1 hypothetical protein [Bacillus swezeyi]MED2928920.1 hypothetical protein [Bacillus swezeyi]